MNFIVYDVYCIIALANVSDKTVRNSINDIVQFTYGDDNIDGCKLITQVINSNRVHLPFNIMTLKSELSTYF